MWEWELYRWIPRTFNQSTSKYVLAQSMETFLTKDEFDKVSIKTEEQPAKVSVIILTLYCLWYLFVFYLPINSIKGPWRQKLYKVGNKNTQKLEVKIVLSRKYPLGGYTLGALTAEDRHLGGNEKMKCSFEIEYRNHATNSRSRSEAALE